VAALGVVELERDDVPDEVRRQLGVVKRNVDRLDRLVADLLQTAQVERCLVHLERERTDPAALVRQSLEAVGPALEVAGLTLASRGPQRLVVMVDPQRFVRVVDNLLSNAVKDTPSGGSRWTCRSSTTASSWSSSTPASASASACATAAMSSAGSSALGSPPSGPSRASA
jgi:signal transduction histidine kinase